MSWLIDDNVSGSVAHLDSYDNKKYYNEDSWRLTKNMAFIAPSNQKYQTVKDLDSFLVTDEDFGFSKKFNGFTFKTSDEMPTLSQTQGSLPTGTESYKSISSTTFSKDFTATQKLYKKEEIEFVSDVVTFTSEEKHISFTAYCSGTITANVNDNHSSGKDDCYFYILKNGEEAASADADSGSSMTVDYDKGDIIEFKAVNYRGHSPNSEITSYNPSIKVTWENREIQHHMSYYNDAYTESSGWDNSYIGEAQNNPIIGLWRCRRTNVKSGSIKMRYATNSTTKTYYAAYVGGILVASSVSEAVSDAEQINVKWSNVDRDSEIIFYHRPYFDGTVPKTYLEDEVDWAMSYCCKNEITSWATNIKNINIVDNTLDNTLLWIKDSVVTDELGDIVTLSNTQTRTRSGYNLTDATSTITILPKINGLPYKGTTLHTPSYSSSTDFISPNEQHRKSGHFVATEDGTVSVKCVIQSLTAYINSYDGYQSINPTITIKKNDTQVASYSNFNRTESYTTSFSVSAGDLIAINVSGTFTQNSYYELDYDGEVVDKCYLTGDKDETGFTVYKDNYNSSYSPAYDMAFIAKTEGTLSWSYGDVRNSATSSSSDGILNIFVNGERRVKVDRDNSINGSLSLSAGDVVLIRYCAFTCSVGDKDAYEYVERGWDTPGGQCTISFSGETVPVAFNHTLSWKEYCKLILNEARLWVDDNLLTDYALPIAIIDDAEDLERLNQFYTELSNSKLYVDLWACTDNLGNLNTSYVKCFNADMKDSPIPTDKFKGASVSQVRVKDATSGTNAFADFNKTIKQLELVDISGNWDYAFRNSTIEKLDFGTFRTKGLTSAYCMFKDCDLHYLTEDVIKTFFNDTYDKWYKGYISFRSAFIGSINSGTVPEVYMSIDDQYDCNWDPAILIQKVVSTYDVNILPLGYHFYGHPNYTDASRLFLSNSSTVHTIKVEARHYNETTDQAAKIYLDGSLLKSNGGRRGHYICVIDCKTRAIKFEKQADTYGEPTSADSVWSEAINIASENDLIIATSCDATSLTQAARDIMNSAGGIDSIGTWTQQRIAHAFIGKKGVGVNKGFEMTQSGSEYSLIEASFDENRGLIHQDWKASSTFGLSPVCEKESIQDHFGNYPNIIVPEEDFWKWGPVFSQIKDCYDYAGLSYTSNDKANFSIKVLTSGDEKQVNPNYETSLGKAVEASTFDNLILHLRKVENTTDKSISIEGMFKNIRNLHCVGEIKNIQDITSAFEGCDNIIEVRTNLNNVEIADYAFKNCDSLKTITVFSNSCFSAMHMFEDCDALEDFDISGMTSLIDGTSMFENCVGLKTDFTKPSKLPNNLQIARKMFAGCNVKEISGTWIPPNTYTSYRNQYENGIGNLEDDWTNEVALSKEGWTFPEQLSDAYMMFKGNPITKISNLSFNPNANNSWIFQDCNNLIIIKDSYLNIDTFDDAKYTGMFDGCSLKKENVLWLPISISSKFDLKQTGITYDSNEKPIQYLVDDHWCEVDNSGFVEYQHIRRPKYLQVYKDNGYDDILIKFWSHPHIHSAEMRGYNELHDTKVYYDPESLHGGLIDYNKWLRKD